MQFRMIMTLLETTICVLSDNKGPMTTNELSLKCFGHTRAIGAMRKALFTLLEHGLIARHGAPKDDTYIAILKPYSPTKKRKNDKEQNS